MAGLTFAGWWSTLQDREGLSLQGAADRITAAGAPIDRRSVHTWRNGTLPSGEDLLRAIESAFALDHDERAAMRRLLAEDARRSRAERRAAARAERGAA